MHLLKLSEKLEVSFTGQKKQQGTASPELISDLIGVWLIAFVSMFAEL